MDGGPSYDGYVSDIIREAVIGKPTDYQQEMFDVAREACYRGIDAMKPGTPIDQVVKVVDDFMDNSKFAEINVYKHWCGHSIGVGVHEYPMLDSDTHILLKPGMVFSIEPSRRTSSSPRPALRSSPPRIAICVGCNLGPLT